MPSLRFSSSNRFSFSTHPSRDSAKDRGGSGKARSHLQLLSAGRVHSSPARSALSRRKDAHALQNLTPLYGSEGQQDPRGSKIVCHLPVFLPKLCTYFSFSMCATCPPKVSYSFILKSANWDVPNYTVSFNPCLWVLMDSGVQCMSIVYLVLLSVFFQCVCNCLFSADTVITC